MKDVRMVLSTAMAALVISCSQPQAVAPKAVSQQTQRCCQISVSSDHFVSYGGLSEDISPLMKAANTAKLHKAKQLVELEQVEVNLLDHNGQNALHHLSSYSIAGGEASLLKIAALLIEHGIDIDQLNRLGDSPLIAAIRRHRSAIAIALIQRGANVNLADAETMSPLMLAAYYGDIAVVNALLDYGAKVNAQDKQGRNALHYLAAWPFPDGFFGSKDIARALLNAGIDATAIANDGRNAYQWAIENHLEQLAYAIKKPSIGLSEREQVQLAIDDLDLSLIAGLSETPQGRQQLTAVLSAQLPIQRRMSRYPDADLDAKQVQMLQLIAPYIDINQRNTQGQTALHIATANQQINTMQALLKLNPDLALTDHHGLTAPDVAALSGDEKVFKVFVEPVHPSLSIALFKTDILSRIAALESRGDYGPSLIIDALLRLGMDPDASNAKGQTALCLAVKSNKPMSARILFEHAADVDLADNQGLTPVMYAVKFGRIAMLRRLLKHQPDLTSRNNQGFSAIEMTQQVTSVGGQAVQSIIYDLLAQAE